MSNQSDRSLPAVIGEAIDLLTKFSVPLYVNDEYRRPEQFGTGFFVRVGGSHFLVSAAHVLDVARTRRVYFYAAKDKLRHLTGHVLTTGDPADRERDLVDVGVMEFTGDGMPPYPDVDKVPMDISYLKPRYLPRSGKHYTLVGFPATKSIVDTKDRTALVSPYAYRSDPIEDNRYPEQGFTPESHVLLPLDLRRGFDPAGKKRIFPKPQGMSGSPIVVLYEEASDYSTGVPVVAVGTRYRRNKKLLIGTDIGFALGAIEQFLNRSRRGAR
jgi:hypothetical protein